MVVDYYVEGGGSGYYLFGQLDIGLAGGGVTAGVVVDEDEGGCP